MSQIILGAATAHSPFVSAPAATWLERGKIDVERGFGAPMSEQAEREHLPLKVRERRHGEIQSHIDSIAAAVQSANLDTLIVVGHDHDEIFPREWILPPISVYTGATLSNPPRDLSAMSDWHRMASWGYYPSDDTESYACDPELADHLLTALTHDCFDVTRLAAMPPGREVGHTFAFVGRRVLRGPTPPALVPLILNTWTPPNQPSVRRCYALGQAVASAVRLDGLDRRVGVLTSGGLSHPVIDEELDRAVLDALSARRPEQLFDLPEERLQLGNSEMKSWTVAAGVLDNCDMTMHLLGYIPGYRSSVGTGCGVAFALWETAK